MISKAIGASPEISLPSSSAIAAYISSCAPTPSAGPTANYTVTKADKTYAQAKEAAAGGKLACVADDADFQAITAKLDADGTVTCAWLGAEYADGAWKWADNTALSSDDSHWADGDSKTGPYLLLVKKDGTWVYTSSNGEIGDNTGKIGYVVETSA